MEPTLLAQQAVALHKRRAARTARGGREELGRFPTPCPAAAALLLPLLVKVWVWSHDASLSLL